MCETQPVDILLRIPGSDAVDQALTLFLSTGIILGGVVGFILDNIVPGNPLIVHLYNILYYTCT